jgi:hypothetical protein
MKSPRQIRLRLGHTLVELVTAMVSGTILLAGLGGVMMIASQVAYTPSASVKRLDAAKAVQEFGDDARYATLLATRSSHLLEFVVTDRDGDGAAERIRYQWSGVPGAPLLKTLNGGTPVAVVDSVEDFQISVATASQTTPFATTTDSAEAVLASNTATPSGTTRTIDAANFSAQRINPSGFSGVPGSATAWNLTKVDFQGSKNGATDATLRVQIRSASNPYDSPTGEVLGEVVVPEASVTTSSGWNTTTFTSPVRGLALHRGYSLVWRGTDGESGTPLRLVTDDNAATSVHESIDAGASWTYMSARRTYYRIYGTYTSPGTTVNVTRNYATRVNVMLQAGEDTSSRVDVSIPLENTPELLSAYWRTDFDFDPTTADVTRDGVADWAMASGTFNTAKLVDGIWQASGAIESRAKNDFATNTIVDVRCRNTAVGGNGAVVRINADRQAGTHAPLEVRLQRQSDATQTLTLYGKTSSATYTQLFQRKNLPSSLIRCRLTILPANNLVNLAIEDEDQGTFSYPTYAPSADDRFLTLYTDTSSSEFDYVELRIPE